MGRSQQFILKRTSISSLICPSYGPDKEAEYILDTIDGFSRRHQLEIGTDVDIEPASPDNPTITI